jgi:serine/threonine-protein phosphatase 2A activator
MFQDADQVLLNLVPKNLTKVVPLIKPYFLSSFGSFVRMDYGTGHETSFALFLLCLTLAGFFTSGNVSEERDLVLRVFTRYLRLCYRLQDVYKLEPAGSHGVWGLDDSHFLPYIFGSGQLREQKEIPVNAVLKNPLPQTNLYFMSIMRIHEVKHGPFHEHSAQLHSIAVGVPNWGKVNSGLFKMYEVRQHGSPPIPSP